MCKEDYTVGEEVRQLPCNHFFHSSCIVPWLELVSTDSPAAGRLRGVCASHVFWGGAGGVAEGEGAVNRGARQVRFQPLADS